MGTAWSAEQVLALAPDAGSAKSGKDLAAPRKWVSLGSGDDVLWGECQGSGASPYQTKIDLTGPAFHCSCPSRKFPCKHGLGLFLLWTAQPALFSRADPPPWVATWLEARSRKAEQKAQKEKDAPEKRGPVDPAAAAKREASRLSRVNAGLDDLALWMSDLVRDGLATVRDRPAGIWDDQARRLVDAQAPGLARRLRQVGELPLSGEGWHEAILDRLGRIHLAVEGGRKAASLSAEARADLNTVLGLPVDTDALRAGPGVRDAWQVVGQRVDQEDALRAQRTWLVGATSKRPALVLDFAHGSQPLDTTLPPGIQIDADLAFFPGSAPLRALVQNRHGAPVGIDSLAGHATAGSAYDAYARTLARNPWLELYPLVLDGVVLVERGGAWWLRDAEGGVFPLPERFDPAWHVLAITGGRPFAVSGEFDGTTFDPMAFAFDGRFRPFPSGPRTSTSRPASVESPPALAALWKEVSASALVGVERRPSPTSGPFSSMLIGLDAREPAARLLGLAGASGWYGRVGRNPSKESDPAPEPCAADDRPECPPAAARRLRRMLGGEFPEFLPEWLGLATAAGARVPADALPELLTTAKQQSDLRPAVRAVLGARGLWLSEKNPEWAFVGAGVEQAEPEAVWQTGTRPDRLALLTGLRKTEPARARALVESTWAAEKADDRAEFLGAFAEGLGADDEPFLESALDDRGKTVRRAAADLLTRLPGSRFSLRMVERCSACLKWDGRTLDVTPPAACDSSMTRDGFESDPKRSAGERERWLRYVVSSTPPTAWSSLTGTTPARLIPAALAGDWPETLWPAWAAAAVATRDEAWAAALLEKPLPSVPRPGPFWRDLLAVLSAPVRDALLQNVLKADGALLLATDPEYHLLRAARGPFGADLARAVVRRVIALVAAEPSERARREAGGEKSVEISGGLTTQRVFRVTPPFHAHDIFAFIRSLARSVPLDLLAEAERGLPPDDDPTLYYRSAYREFLDALRFRHETHQEFAR